MPPILSRHIVARREPHDGFFAQLRAAKLAGDAALVHHERAIGQADDFFQFARRKQNRNAAAGQLVHQFVDFFFRADIDAARRFIEQQQLRASGKATCRARPFADCRPRGIARPVDRSAF